MLLAQTPLVTIRQTSVSAMDNNVYLLTSRATGRQVLIDAADDADAIVRLQAEAADDGPSPHIDLIVTTHSHWDHIRALASLAKSTGARLVAGADDVADVEQGAGVTALEPVEHGATVGVDGVQLRVVGLRGHTPGSVALVLQEDGQPTRIFSGDSLFPGGVGNTWQDPARFQQLLADVEARLFAVYPDNAEVHPGHGKSTTLGAERPELPSWRERGW